MTEYMTFQEARSKAKDGDLLRLVSKREGGSETTTEIKVGEKGEFRLSFEQYDSDQWQIISAEQKVLSAEEYINREYDKPFPEGDLSIHDIEYTFEFANQNGRLERDLELRDAIKGYWYILELISAQPVFSNSDGAPCVRIEFSRDWIAKREESLKNLKPLN